MPRGGIEIEAPGRGPWCGKIKKKEEEGRMLDRKSRTPVMPWDSMRIDEPGRGPWCENEKKKKKKGKEEWRRKGVADSCYASGWHENRGTRSREKKKKKKKGRMEEKGSRGLLLCLGMA